MENIFNDIKFGPIIHIDSVSTNELDSLVNNKTGTGNYRVGDFVTYIGESDDYIIEGNSYEVIEICYADNTVKVLDEDNDHYWLDFDQVEY